MLVCNLGSMLLNLLLPYCLQIGIPGLRKEGAVCHWLTRKFEKERDTLPFHSKTKRTAVLIKGPVQESPQLE